MNRAIARRIATASVVVGGVVGIGLGRDVDAAKPLPPPPSIDLVAAIRTAGICGPFGQSLPPLVLLIDAQPGDRIDRIEICLRNDGSVKGGVRLIATERVDSETGCSPGEAVVDMTCGGAGKGELGSQLVIPIAVRPGCSGKPSSSIGYPFDTLSKSGTPVATLRPGDVWCVLMGLEYRPSSDAAASAGQTDRLTWRYVFELGS